MHLDSIIQLTVGLNDLTGHFQPKQVRDSLPRPQQRVLRELPVAWQEAGLLPLCFQGA